ncbi:MAG: bifunctional UDP-N-acetylmuramoyl-tripeptide:D-alanyl-D-alanine ligase/alanine racemase, partial [Taibaiella sp.]|nr:bifunctional UDP-N-acetylmuramoyl-tripeptide:D-alanyl-D-alanine ligase/alanine racemase [Taibaiella sp.]
MNTCTQIKQWSNGTWLHEWQPNAPIDELATDSRKIEKPEATLFIPIKTTLRNGHAFIAEAYRQGVRSFLISEDVDLATLPDANIIKVKDTVAAMQQVAAAKRKLFNIPIVGITGSNGKTIVKEWLYQLLGDQFKIARSPKSYNSQIGVPLSVWQLKPDHQLGVFEAGISQPGEMGLLEKIIYPTIGVFTNIGEAHNEGFLNIRQKINEKLLLFRHARHLVYCRDNAQLNECIVPFLHHVTDSGNEHSLRLFSWSTRQEATLRITAINKLHHKTEVAALYQERPLTITIPFTDEASIENAIHCWCVALLLQAPDAAIQAGMAALQPVSMRLELRHGSNDCTIINDAYNSDLTSLQLALTYLDQQKQHTRHTVIMSDLLQMGRRDIDLYDDVAQQVSRRGVQRFIGIGPALYKNKSSFRKYKQLRSIFFKSTADFLKNFHLLTFSREAILLKGARVFAFEQIAMLLEQQVHQTVMSISLPAMRQNLDVFRGALRPGVKTMAMVKA